MHWNDSYTLSHLENDRDVSAWYQITRWLSCVWLLCFLTRSKRNPGIDAQMMRFAAFIPWRAEWRHGRSRDETKYRCCTLGEKSFRDCGIRCNQILQVAQHIKADITPTKFCFLSKMGYFSILYVLVLGEHWYSLLGFYTHRLIQPRYKFIRLLLHILLCTSF